MSVINYVNLLDNRETYRIARIVYQRFELYRWDWRTLKNCYPQVAEFYSLLLERLDNDPITD